MLYRFPLKSVAGETLPAFPAHAQPAIFKYLVRGPCTRSDHKSASVAGPGGGGGGGGGGVLGPKTDGGVPLAAENWTPKDRGKNEIWGLKDRIL